jgi:transcriptional regulator with XRE-family HTH domain
MRNRTNLKHTKMLLRLLKALRADSGMRQAEVAHKLGKPQSFVSKYEAGERKLDVLELKEVCGALGISLQEFVQRLEELYR